MQITGIGRLTPPSSRRRGRRTTVGIRRPMPPPCGRWRGALPTCVAGSARADFAITAMCRAGWLWRRAARRHRRRAAASFRAEGAEIIAMGKRRREPPETVAAATGALRRRVRHRADARGAVARRWVPGDLHAQRTRAHHGSRRRSGRRAAAVLTHVSGPCAVYGKLTNRSRKSVALAAPPSIGFTLKISWSVRSVELWS